MFERDNSKYIRSILILLLLALVIGIFIYREVYPVRLTRYDGFTNQIPFTFWLTVSFAIFLLISITFLWRSSSISFFSAILFYLLYASDNLFFKGTGAGGFSSDRLSYVWKSKTIQKEPPFYFNGDFPVHDILQRIQYLLFPEDIGVITSIEISFFYYVVLFAASVWFFVYSYTGDSFSSFLATAILLVIGEPIAIRFRLVPQFLALTILIFLISVHIRGGQRFKLMKYLLWTGLILSHPLLFLFYLGAVVLTPFGYSVWKGLDTNSSNTFLGELVRSARNPIFSIQAMSGAFRDSIFRRTWSLYTLSLLLIYMLFYAFNFYFFQTRVFIEVFGVESDVDTSLKILDWLYGVDIGVETDQVPTQQLYHLTNIDFSLYTSISAQVIVGTTGLLLAGASLLRKHNSFNGFHFALIIASAIYFVAGFLLPIHGNRALQILFLPFVISVALLSDNKKVLLLVVLILLSSPILVVNSLNNHELGSGERHPDYYTEVSGEFIEQQKYEHLIQPGGRPGTIKPVTPGGTEQKIEITKVLPGLEERYYFIYEPQAGDMIQFDYRMYHRVAYFMHECNFEKQNKIYNIEDGNAILIVSDYGFNCSEDYL